MQTRVTSPPLGGRAGRGCRVLGRAKAPWCPGPLPLRLSEQEAGLEITPLLLARNFYFLPGNNQIANPQVARSLTTRAWC